MSPGVHENNVLFWITCTACVHMHGVSLICLGEWQAMNLPGDWQAVNISKQTMNSPPGGPRCVCSPTRISKSAHDLPTLSASSKVAVSGKPKISQAFCCTMSFIDVALVCCQEPNNLNVPVTAGTSNDLTTSSAECTELTDALLWGEEGKHCMPLEAPEMLVKPLGQTFEQFALPTTSL